jgi:hypothetical protein
MMSIGRLGIVAVCVVIVWGQYGHPSSSQANELGRVHDMKRFRKQLRVRLVRRHDHKKAVYIRHYRE